MSVLAVLPPFAEADDAFRCSFAGRVVDVGDSEADVRTKCGAPTVVETQVMERRWKGRTFITTVDLWTYNLGPTRFVRVLRFQEAFLSRILTGNYGS